MNKCMGITVTLIRNLAGNGFNETILHIMRPRTG